MAKNKRKMPAAIIVEAGSWYEAAVNWASENGIVNGYSAEKFGPNDPITREQLAAILYRYEKMKKDSSAAPQNDIAEDAILDEGTHHEDAILDEGTHHEDVILNGVKDPSPVSKYTDADRISDWAADAMAWCVAEGIINGVTETTLEPQGRATRAQVATMLMRCSTQDE